MQQSKGKFTVGSIKGLSDLQLHQLQHCLSQPTADATETLGGRAAVATLDLANIGSVVVKHYTRGGLIRTINYNTYLNISGYRCKDEFDVLSALYKAGVSVPEPIAYVYKRKLFYNAWLVIREVESAQTLVKVSISTPQQLPEIIEQLREQVKLLVDHKIHHVDLHPGNVLIGADNKLVIIDFDKASSFQGTADELWGKYISRWQRALTKHQLSEKLTLSGPLAK